jgi:HK97 family phage portal protein
VLDTLRSRIARFVAPDESKGVTVGAGVTGGLDFIGPVDTGNLIYFDGRNDIDKRVTENTAFAVAAMCYAAIQYRAGNIAEAPLRVARELPDGTFEFVDHPLDRLLAEPSLDYDMGETMELTMQSLDLYARSMWVKDLDRMGRVGRLMPFGGQEFHVEAADGRIYGKFVLDTSGGKKDFTPEEVVHFKYLSPYSRYDGVSPTDAALGWLNLGADVESSVRRFMRNGMFPSVIISPDKEWRPGDDEYDRFKKHITQFQAGPANQGRPFVALGGSKVERVAFALKDLLPDEIMDRIEASVAMCFGIAPVILGALVGLKNSPWSQMAEARRFTYDDTIQPLWEKLGRTLTRQLLRPIDPRPELSIRFDTSGIVALQVDQSAKITDAQTATTWTLDERRTHSGQEPIGGADGDWIEALSTPTLPAPPADDDAKSERDRSFRWWTYDLLAKASEPVWEREAFKLLSEDSDAYVARVETPGFTSAWDAAVAAEGKADEGRVAALLAALTKGIDRIKPWVEGVTPLYRSGSASALQGLSKDTGIAFDVLIEGLGDYVDENALRLATQIDETTKERLAQALNAGLDAGEGIGQIAKRIEESSAFGRPRALLVAQTETTSNTNGAQKTSLSSYQADNDDVIVEKAWLSSRDVKVRKEHVELDKRGAESGWIGIDEEYDNGLQHPGEPNCRCGQIFRLRDAS